MSVGVEEVVPDSVVVEKVLLNSDKVCGLLDTVIDTFGEVDISLTVDPIYSVDDSSDVVVSKKIKITKL